MLQSMEMYIRSVMIIKHEHVEGAERGNGETDRDKEKGMHVKSERDIERQRRKREAEAKTLFVSDRMFG